MTSNRRKKIQQLFDAGSKDLEEAQLLPSTDPRQAELLNSALQTFEETVRIHPQFVLGYRKIAFIHEKRGDEKETIRTLEKILELQPHDETATLKMSELQKAAGKPEEAARIEIQTHYEEVQDILKKYEDAEPDLGGSAAIIWEGIGRPRLESDEQLLRLFREVDMTINKINVRDGTFVVTNRRIILEGLRIYGSQTASAVARQYEYKRGTAKKDGSVMPDTFIGLSLPYDEIDESKLLWFGQVPTVHVVFQSDGHAGISGIPPAMAEDLMKTLDSQGIIISRETIKLCAPWLVLFFPLATILSVLFFLA